MDVKENIIYGLKKRGIPKKIIEEKLQRMMKIVNLAGLEKRRINELSGGQQQRVALARSLIIEPEILLLDEPLANLDKKLRISMQFELKEIQRITGTTFLYVTHDQGEALTMSDSIGVMDNGNIMQVGSPSEIYDTPSSIFAADFIGAGNFINLKHVSKTGNENVLALEALKGEIIKYQLPARPGPLIQPANGLQEKTLIPVNPGAINQDNPPVFFIRPERIKIYTGDADIKDNKDNLNILTGVIDSIVFEGPDIKLIVNIPGLGIVKTEIKNEKKHLRLKEKSEIRIYWEHEEGILFSPA
jgi:ABC-type Fe3+/spermidine/putrescine transport system ATPase subunit